MKCESCGQNKKEDDMFFDWQCDDCFELMMEKEDKDILIFDQQKSLCFLCLKWMSGWIIKNNRSVCYPDCKGYRLS